MNIFATATAVASEPPLPIVVISPFFEIPWKPGMIAIPSSQIFIYFFNMHIYNSSIIMFSFGNYRNLPI